MGSSEILNWELTPDGEMPSPQLKTPSLLLQDFGICPSAQPLGHSLDKMVFKINQEIFLSQPPYVWQGPTPQSSWL